jgi:hypothetical protein
MAGMARYPDSKCKEFCALRKTPEAIAACGNCSASNPSGWLKPRSGLSLEFE